MIISTVNINPRKMYSIVEYMLLLIDNKNMRLSRKFIVYHNKRNKIWRILLKYQLND